MRSENGVFYSSIYGSHLRQPMGGRTTYNLCVHTQMATYVVGGEFDVGNLAVLFLVWS